MMKELRRVVIVDASGKIKGLYCAVDAHSDIETILTEHFPGYQGIREDHLVTDTDGKVYSITVTP